MIDVADFIHNSQHPYWERIKEDREFCVEVYLAVQAALGIAIATSVVASEDEPDRARRAKNFVRACRAALCSIKVIRNNHIQEFQRKAQQKKLERSQAHQQTVAQSIVAKEERIKEHNIQREKELRDWKSVAVSLAKELVSLGKGDVLKRYTIQGTSMDEMLDRMNL